MSDLQTLAELERVPLGLPAGLELEWLGVAGYRLSYEGVSILVDPYVSRVPLRSVLLRRRALPNTALINRHIGPASAVLIGHTHWDHAVDAPALAQRDRATVYGSRSLAHLMRLHGLESVVVEPHHPYEIGPFVVRFVPSRHSKLIFGRKVPFDGPLTCEDLHELTPGAYKCGDVFGIRIEVAGTSFYHQGSANLDDAQRIEPVDVFLAGITGRQVTPRYWERILPRLDPRLLVPTHYDDFFAPLDTPLKLVRRVGIEALPGEVAAVSRDAAIAAVPRARARPPATPGGGT